MGIHAAYNAYKTWKPAKPNTGRYTVHFVEADTGNADRYFYFHTDEAGTKDWAEKCAKHSARTLGNAAHSIRITYKRL